MKKLGHIDENGKIRMIDNTDKPVRIHEAEATGFIQLKPETVRLIK
jgi:molybdenum cofactor biosynthesis enzyme